VEDKGHWSFFPRVSPSFEVLSVSTASGAGSVTVGFADRGFLPFPSKVMFGFGFALLTVEGYPFDQAQTSPLSALVRPRA